MGIEWVQGFFGLVLGPLSLGLALFWANGVACMGSGSRIVIGV